MIQPKRIQRGPNTADNPYVCPERSKGHHYFGPTRISLVDRGPRQIVNTIPIRSSERDSFAVPYLIRPDQSHYPVLLALRDINGYGLAMEAAFFDAQACMGLLTALVRYSAKQDRVMLYPKRADRPTICFRSDRFRGTLVWREYASYPAASFTSSGAGSQPNSWTRPRTWARPRDSA